MIDKNITINTFNIANLQTIFTNKTYYPHLNEFTGGVKCQENLYHNLTAALLLTIYF